MSLFYQIVFPQNAPEAAVLLQQQVSNWGEGFELQAEAENQLVVLHQNKLVVAIVVSHENNYFELDFGEYHYSTDWYIELGKTDGLTAMRFYVELLGKVFTTYQGDFLSLFNGELVVAQRKGRNTYLNTESSIWKKAENLAVLANQGYEFATYQVE